MRKLFAIICIILLTGCFRKKENLVYSYNAEPDTTWINKKNLQEFADAHSGQFICITDSVNNFSIGFRKTLSAISRKTLRTAKISAWVYLADSTLPVSGLSLVGSIDNKDKNVFWAEFPVGDKITETKKWIFVSGDLFLNAELKPGYVFTGYVLNNSKKKILIDDLEFQFGK